MVKISQTGRGGFGEYFRTLRKRRSLSQTQLGEIAGVSIRTLAYWESGEREPRADEFNNTFEALNASAEERAHALALLRSVRGAQLASQQAASQYADPHLGELPHLGDLLRAMRLRKGWSREQLAVELHVNHSTLVRWEAMQTLPSDDNMKRLCEALNAEKEETDVLQNHRLLPDSAPVLTLEMAFQRVEAFELESLMADCPLADLRALILKRQLRLLVPRSPEALHLLARVETSHSRWLAVHDRLSEAETLAKRALSIVHPRFKEEAFWHMALNVISISLTGRDGNHQLTALRYLRRWIGMISDPTLLALVYMDMATYAARAEQHTAAQQFLHHSHMLSTSKSNAGIYPSGNGGNIVKAFREEQIHDYYQTSLAQVLSAGNHAHKAVDLLLPLPTFGDKRIFRQYLIVKALHKAGTRQDAATYLNRLLQETAGYTGIALTRRIDSLVRLMNGQ